MSAPPQPPATATEDGPSEPKVAGRAVCLVSLGCSKNLVDSEVMAGHLGRAGLELVADPAESDLVIVNTCGFIDAAREESIDTILEYVEMKERGELAGVVVTGCLVQLHADALSAELPEVDAFLPLSDYSGVPSIVNAVLGGTPSEVCPAGEAPGGAPKAADNDLGRALLTPAHTAYLRLGEGCDHICAFCAIPHIRGKLKSKPMEVLLEEAGALATLGARELTLIAEDTTDYGKDLKAGYGLADLLTGLGDVDGLEWVRVMYAHPATMDQRLIETMARVDKVVPYLDMPVQHGDADVLRAMRRGTSPDRIRKVVGWLRASIPDLVLRTTILVGFPGETEQAYARLLELLDELAFDRLGCFVYSAEPGTEADGLPGEVSREVAEERRAEVMRRQRQRVTAAHQRRVGSIERVLVDAVEALDDRPDADSGLRAIGRTRFDAPEVDGRVLVELPSPNSAAARALGDIGPGDFLSVRMTGVKGYDLTGTLAP